MASGGSGSGEGGSGRKRKASPPEALAAATALRREPRRGMGVAELERIRVAIEVAERCYAAVSSLTSSASAALPPPPASLHPTMASYHQHRYHHLLTGDVTQVGNGAVRHHHQLQMPRASSYLAPYRLPQHYVSDDSLTRLFTSNGGHPSSVHHQRHQQPTQIQIQSAATALPVTTVTAAQSASSQSSSSGNQLLLPWQARRRASPPAPPRHNRAALPPQQVAFVDLVDSDDDTEELDLELKL